MSARVLVTGATGFIGARLAASLASSGREVRCLVRVRGGGRARALEREGFDLHEGDQIGGPDVLTYGEMLDRMAEVLDIRRRPRIPVPLITPWLSSLWIGLVTPVDAGIARPRIEGLAVPTVVTDPSAMRLFDTKPINFDEALRRAVAEDPELVTVLGRLFLSRPGVRGQDRAAHDRATRSTRARAGGSTADGCESLIRSLGG